MNRLAIVTATRAEYGLLSRVIKAFQDDPDIDLNVVVTGTHLSEAHGMTVNEIKSDGVVIDREIPILSAQSGPRGISETMANALVGFTEYFEDIKPDCVLLLGDRYETLAIAEACMNCRIPIAHIGGGEVTEGAIDEAVRHSITKMSYIHFTSAGEFKKRVEQLGEDPERVFFTGSLGVENSMKENFISKKELEAYIGCTLGEKYAVGTFHPVTLEKDSARFEAAELIKAITAFNDIKFLFTKANADDGGNIINAMLSEAAKEFPNIILVDSLGKRRYLSALKNCEFVIGNSSSGLLEAPCFHIATVNIGDRQKGRLRGETVIDCGNKSGEIITAINEALMRKASGEFANSVSPYGDANASVQIHDILKKHLCANNFDLKKKFFDK